jgi:hypothetical protein
MMPTVALGGEGYIIRETNPRWNEPVAINDTHLVSRSFRGHPWQQ